jgi:hypothetical protein
VNVVIVPGNTGKLLGSVLGAEKVGTISVYGGLQSKIY